MRLKVLGPAAVAGALMASGASAASVTYTDSVGLSATNFSGLTLSVPQFDGSLGVLQSIDFTLNGLVEGVAEVESRDALPAVINLDLGAEITASTTAINILAVVLPVASETFNATAFDGSIDFGGTSGVTYGALSASDSDTRTLTGSDMAEFIGAGSVDIFLAATGQSSATGPGNVISSFTTDAGGDIEVTYNFDDPTTPIPLPAAGWMLIAGLAGLSFVKRRRC